MHRVGVDAGRRLLPRCLATSRISVRAKNLQRGPEMPKTVPGLASNSSRQPASFCGCFSRAYLGHSYHVAVRTEITNEPNDLPGVFLQIVDALIRD